MILTKKQISAIFENLGNDNAEEFFSHVADDVQWSVLGTHPLAGVYHSKADFRKATITRLNNLMQDGLALHLEYIWLDGQTAAVELSTQSVTKTGKPFNNQYCWICRFDNEKIIEVRAYLDSTLVKQVIEESEDMISPS